MTATIDLTCCSACRKDKPIIVVDAKCSNCSSVFVAEWTMGVEWYNKKVCPACGCENLKPTGFHAEVQTGVTLTECIWCGHSFPVQLVASYSSYGGSYLCVACADVLARADLRGPCSGQRGCTCIDGVPQPTHIDMETAS